ncbi:MAG: substrate-binding domain-containing protein [Oscillospiraceae bacterium]
MKKFLKTIALVSALAVTALLPGCTDDADSSAASTTTSGTTTSVTTADGGTDSKYLKTEYNLVFIPKLVHEWYEEVKEGIDQAVAELAEQGITVNYTWDAPADAIVTDQIAKIEAAAAKKPDGISVAIIDAAATTTVINELVAYGINVSTFDCDATDSDRLYYCGHSKNYEDGYEMANKMAEALGEKGEVAVLAGTLSAINHQERVKGFVDGIAQYPNMTIVDTQADEDSIEVALGVAEGYIATYPNLKGIFGCNAASPLGAARAVTDAGKAGEIIICGMAEDQEAMQYVQDGTIYCTLRQAVPTYGYNSVYNMLEIADGREPSVVFDEIPAHFVTKENVADFLE